MTEWKEYKFSDFVEINPSVKIPKGIPVSFVEMKDLDSSVRYCESSQKKELTGGSRFINGDTLFARITPCMENGKICQVRNLENGFGFGSTEFHILRGKDGVSDCDFVYYLSRWDEVRDHAEHNMEGSSGRQRVPKQAFDNLYLSLPPLETQRRIAAILSSLDDKIDLLHRENATLEQMAETLFRQWFVVEAKEEWEERPLSSIATFLNGLACQKYPPKNEIDKLPVLKIRELSSGIGNDSDWATTDVGSEYIVHAGDVIFAWSASLMVRIWNGEDCILNQHLFKVTSEKYPKWFYYFWCKHHLDEFISIAQSHATTMGHIKRNDLDTAIVLVPSDEELLIMTEKMDGLLQKMENNNKQIQTLIQTRDGLLPKLMSGEVKI
ncbi:MAG: restriction endonuclease subunit S [Paludibacteraceae bacterium]|nr:restriction endonuclease subunit S [Paludibacteraceae bacterium]